MRDLDIPKRLGTPDVLELMRFAPIWMPDETARYFDSILDEDIRLGIARLEETDSALLTILMARAQECLLAELARCGLVARFPQRLTPEQVAYLNELGTKPLGLWEVQMVSPQRFGVAPLKSPRSEMVELREPAISKNLIWFDVVAARVISDRLKPTLSAIFFVEEKEARQLLRAFKPASKRKADVLEAGNALERELLRRHLRCAAVAPKLKVVAGGGNVPVTEIVNDRYTVLDLNRLRQLLAAAVGLRRQGKQEDVWERYVQLDGKPVRSLATVKIAADVLVIESQNRSAAADNRRWLKDVAETAVRFRSRKVL